MPSSYFNRVKFSSSTAGTSAFGVGAAVTGFRTPSQASVADGTAVSYTAQGADFTQWETGHGIYNTAGPTISRTTVLENSSGTTSAINFSVAPTVWLDYLAQDIRTVLTADRTYHVTVFDTGSLVGGSGYANAVYENVPLTGGSGSGARARITVSGGAVTLVQPREDGNPTGYTVGNVLSASNVNLGGAGSGFSVTITKIGSDTTGDGSSAKPWGSGHYASDFISLNVDFNGNVVTVELSTGYYVGWMIGTPATSVPNKSLIAALDLGPSFLKFDGVDYTKVFVDIQPDTGGSCVAVYGTTSVIPVIKNLTIDSRNIPQGAPTIMVGFGIFLIGDATGGTVQFLNSTGHNAGEPIAAKVGCVHVNDNVIINGGNWDYILRADQGGSVAVSIDSAAAFTFVNSPVAATFAQCGSDNADGKITFFGGTTFSGSLSANIYNINGPGSFVDARGLSGATLPGGGPGILNFGGTYIA